MPSYIGGPVSARRLWGLILNPVVWRFRHAEGHVVVLAGQLQD